MRNCEIAQKYFIVIIGDSRNDDKNRHITPVSSVEIITRICIFSGCISSFTSFLLVPCHPPYFLNCRIV